MRVSYLSKLIIMFVTAFFSFSTVFAVPPGYSKSNKYPAGLEGKTPAGWSKGKKKGWHKQHNVKKNKKGKLHRHHPKSYWNDRDRF